MALFEFHVCLYVRPPLLYSFLVSEASQQQVIVSSIDSQLYH